MINITKILNQYLEAALWSSTDETTESGGYPLDRNYTISDFSEYAISMSRRDIELFVEKAGDLLSDLEESNIGHDFWLTRNRHGAGFWDGDYPDAIGTTLTDLSHEFKEIHCIVDDNGEIEIE